MSERRQFDPDHCTACGDFLPCGESWFEPKPVAAQRAIIINYATDGEPLTLLDELAAIVYGELDHLEPDRVQAVLTSDWLAAERAAMQAKGRAEVEAKLAAARLALAACREVRGGRGSVRLGSCCFNVGTDGCTCENPTNWGLDA